MATAVEAERAAPEYADLPVKQLHPHPLNRKHFDPAQLAELEASIRTSGVLTPLLVRPHGPSYQIVAGHRRWTAAQRAGVTELPCRIRELSDEQTIEFLVLENNQREDVHPLDEAQGYAALMKQYGYDVPKIAERIGRSTNYVYDRVKLLQLIKPAQELFFAGKFTAGHAIILARLSPQDQKRAIESDRSGNFRIGGLFVDEMGDDGRLQLDDARKPVSVREFQHWVDEKVRFRPQEQDLPNLFPETHQALQAAREEELKVVKITRDYRVDDEARDPKERTYGEASWKRVDGKAEPARFGGRSKALKPCRYAVLGVVVAGPGRGEAFKVCIEKKKCDLHWAEEQKELARRAKHRAPAREEFGAEKDAKPLTGKALAEAKHKDALREYEDKVSDALRARLRAAVLEQATDLTPELIGLAVALAVEGAGDADDKAIRKVTGYKGALLTWNMDVPHFAAYLAKRPPRELAQVILHSAIGGEDFGLDRFGDESLAKIVGVDVKAIERAVRAELPPPEKPAPEPEPVQTSGKPKKARKAKAKGKGAARA